MDEAYKDLLAELVQQLKARGVKPCSEHGWLSMNGNGTCEACRKADFPDDFAGTE
jgi:hypothetical protein